MQSDRIITAIAIAAVFLAIPFAIGGVDAEQAYDKDYGEFYSYTLQFVFDGADAQTIQWDFGDGTSSTEWNPRHTYAQKGTYYVTQTTTNPKGSTVEIYKVQILGFPVISFDSNGGSPVASIEQTAYNITASKPSDPVKADCRFDGWFYDSELTNAVDWNAGITRSMTLYAKWTPVSAPIVTYTVTFDSNGGSAVEQQTVQSGSTASVPVKPVRAGFTFGDWMLDGHVYNFSTPVTKNITLVASWTKNSQPVITHNIVFDVDGGSSPVSPKSADNGSSFTLPSYDGTKDGYRFGGWTHGNVTYQPGNSIVVSGDMTFKALWISNTPIPSDQNVTVSFDADGGSATIDPMTVKSGSTVTLPKYDGTKDGFKFKGWGIGMLTYQPGDVITVSGDVTAKTIWEKGSDDSGFIGSLKDVFNDPFSLVLVFILILAVIVLAAMIRRRF